MPPDPLRKKQLFSERRTNGHQFFFTTGWKERFVQKSTSFAAKPLCYIHADWAEDMTSSIGIEFKCKCMGEI